MKLHQQRMEAVCYSIKAHHYWVTLEFPFSDPDPDPDRLCEVCGEDIPPEFDMGRYVGLCELRERQYDPFYAFEDN